MPSTSELLRCQGQTLLCAGHTAAGVSHSDVMLIVSLQSSCFTQCPSAYRAGPNDVSFVFASNSVSGCLLSAVPVPLIGKKLKNGSRSQSALFFGWGGVF